MYHLAKKMPEVLNSSMLSTGRMNEEAERILSKPVIKKEPFIRHMLLKIVKMLGKDGKNLINLRFVLMCLLGYFGFLRYSELANLIRSDIRIFQDRLEFFIKQSKTDKFRDCTWIVISLKEITVCPKTHLWVNMKLTNINDNLTNYIFQSVVKLSLVVSSIKVGSCHTLEQERFCWEIWKKLVCQRAV